MQTLSLEGFFYIWKWIKRHDIVCSLIILTPHAVAEQVKLYQWLLLVAVILSAQCTDKRVNLVTFFLAFLMEQCLISSFLTKYARFNHKWLSMAKMLVDEFAGNPKLLMICNHSRSRSAALFVDVPTMPVDTHVFRVSKKWDLLLEQNTFMKTVGQAFPQFKINHCSSLAICTGICQARNP